VRELKHVTALFCDLCGSTEQVANMDPEQAQAFLGTALDLMSQAVKAYGGTVNQFRGDELFALFGAPVAQEDHALRACLAAIDMQRRARDHMRKSGPMRLRVGLASGEVVVGPAAGDAGAFLQADGSTIHLASRLERLAQPGTVLASASTLRLVGDGIVGESLGEKTIQGFTSKVEVFRIALDGAGSAATQVTEHRVHRPLLGRDDVLAALDTLTTQAAAGNLRVIGLRGPAGIGKSRIIAQFCENAKARGFDVRYVAARSYASHVPYGVIADLVRELLGMPKDMDIRQQRGAAYNAIDTWPASGQFHKPALIDLLDLGEQDEDWRALTPSQRRRRIEAVFFWLVSERLASRPILVVIEDIFLADRSSARLIEALVRRLERAPAMVCVSYRPEYEQRWASEPWFLERLVEPLGEDHMASLVTNILGAHDSLKTVIPKLQDMAAGNPFFLEQLAMNLVDSGSLTGLRGAYRCARPDAVLRVLSVPASISAVIAARIDHLPAAAKACVEAAAIVGEPISPTLIAPMVETDIATATDHLRAAVAAGLLIETVTGESPAFDFCHGLVQEVGTGTLTHSRRRLLHMKAFHALRAQLGAQADDAAAILAHHAHCGKAWPEAMVYARKAIERAIERSANRDAVRVLELGLDAAKQGKDDPDLLPLEVDLRVMSLGPMLALGRSDEMVANLERADAISKQMVDVRRQAKVQLQLSVFFWTSGSYRRGLEAADYATTSAIAVGSSSLQMAAAQAHMMQQHGLGRYLEVIAEARDLEARFASELTERRLVKGWGVIASMSTKVFLADALARTDSFEPALQELDIGYRELALKDHAFTRVLLDHTKGTILMGEGCYGEAAEVFRAALSACKTHDVPTMYPPLIFGLGGAMARDGKAEEAISVLERAIADKVSRYGGRYNDFYAPMNVGIALAAVGRYEEAIAESSKARAAAAAFEMTGYEIDALFGIAEIEFAAGRMEAALAHFEKARAMADARSMTRVSERSAERIKGILPQHSHGSVERFAAASGRPGA
jgi:class 3 adenylate cyclase/tetratricopeptide (TPR) repeat protein